MKYGGREWGTAALDEGGGAEAAASPGGEGTKGRWRWAWTTAPEVAWRYEALEGSRVSPLGAVAATYVCGSVGGKGADVM